MSEIRKIFIAGWLLLSFFCSAQAYSVQFSDNTQTARLRWKTGIIPIALSTSLTAPNPYLKPDSDVVGAIKNSLAAWENAANVKFQISWTDKQSISSAGNSGDGVNLITIAPTAENILLFGGDAEVIAGRTRVFFNRKGSISEADIALNPYQQFSTDGAIGTFDLQSTLTHEIGHLLGLEHSTILSATMYERQSKNGVYNLSAFAARTLADDDIAGVRTLYGAKTDENCCGGLSGKLNLANGKSAANFQIWAEDSENGRVIAGVLSDADGNFQLEGLSKGKYRIYARDFEKNVFASEELGEIEIVKGRMQNLVRRLKSLKKNFVIDYVGFNGQIADSAVPINGGKIYTIYVGGKNLDAKNLLVGFQTPFMSIVKNSIVNHDFGADVSVVSFAVKVDTKIPFGDYSFFLKNSKNAADFAVGSLSIGETENQWEGYNFTFDTP